MTAKANYVALPKSNREPVRGARRMAASNPEERMEVSVRLRRTRSAQPKIEGHISYKDLATHYGADNADINVVAAFASENHLTVVESNAAKRTVKLSGTVQAFSQAFDVELSQYEHATMTYRGRTGSINIPKALDGIVTGVFGLDQRSTARTSSDTRSRARCQRA